MDPRIGILIQEGAIVHYAFVNGYDKPETQGTRVEIEVALGLRAAPVAPVAVLKDDKRLRLYIVTVTMKYPAWDETPFDVEVLATSKSDANRKVSDELRWKRRHFDRLSGPVYYRARLAGECQ